jgi:hypothetical protein
MRHPVPIASVPWGYADDTINALNPLLTDTYKSWLMNSCSQMTGGTNVSLLSEATDYPQ